MKEIRIYLVHILQNIGHIERLAARGKQHFLEDSDTQAAVLYYLHTLAESTMRLPEVLQARQPQVKWAQIRGFRNLVVHAYLSVDLDRVWEIIKEDLPTLRVATELMLAEVDTRPYNDD